MIRTLISSVLLLLFTLLLNPSTSQAAGQVHNGFVFSVSSGSGHPGAHRDGGRREIARDQGRERDGWRRHDDRRDGRWARHDRQYDRRHDHRHDRHREAPPRFADRERRTVVLLPPPFFLLPPFWR